VSFWREADCDYGFLLLFLLFCLDLGSFNSFFFTEPLLSTCLFNFLPFLLHILFVCLTRLRACRCMCVRPKKRSATPPPLQPTPPHQPTIHPILSPLLLLLLLSCFFCSLSKQLRCRRQRRAAVSLHTAEVTKKSTHDAHQIYITYVMRKITKHLSKRSCSFNNRQFN